MAYNGTFTAVYRQPGYGNVYGVEYVPGLDQLLAVNISSPTWPSRVLLLDPQTGAVSRTLPRDNVLTTPHTLTHIGNGGGIFVGEISKPFTVWRLAVPGDLTVTREKQAAFLTILTDNIPTSFVVLIVALAVIPIAYLLVVVVFRYSKKQGPAKFDKNGFQKLLRDYDSSDDEEDLVFKNSQVFR